MRYKALILDFNIQIYLQNDNFFLKYRFDSLGIPANRLIYFITQQSQN